MKKLHCVLCCFFTVILLNAQSISLFDDKNFVLIYLQPNNSLTVQCKYLKYGDFTLPSINEYIIDNNTIQNRTVSDEMGDSSFFVTDLFPPYIKTKNNNFQIHTNSASDSVLIDRFGRIQQVFRSIKGNPGLRTVYKIRYLNDTTIQQMEIFLDNQYSYAYLYFLDKKQKLKTVKEASVETKVLEDFSVFDTISSWYVIKFNYDKYREKITSIQSYKERKGKKEPDLIQNFIYQNNRPIASNIIDETAGKKIVTHKYFYRKRE